MRVLKYIEVALYPFVVFLVALSCCAANASSRNVRIVDYGADMGSGDIFYRGKGPEKAKGELAGETFSFWPFSLSEPLNPTPLRYDIDQKSARFYGGLMMRVLNNPQRTISEGHMNSNHEFRDDFNFMGGLAPHLPDEQIEAYGLWFWQKADFWNGGDKYPVSFDGNSFIAVHISRYFGGFHSAHWLVRDGEQFYISKASFGKYVSIDNKDENNFILRKTHILKPLESEWAEYAPAPPHDIAFNPASAKFAKKDFKNITAVGWLIRRELSGPEKVYSSLRPPFAMKWSAFRCDAVVSAPKDQDSFYVPMIRLKDLGLSFSRDEITFQQWEKVRRASVTNQYCYDLGDLNYSFVRDESMGSMRADDLAHCALEPVTDIEWIDAVTFCNALSELEGREPCYYTDAEFKNVLRRPIDRAMKEKWNERPTVHWKENAEGYRLPSAAEWMRTARKPIPRLEVQKSNRTTFADSQNGDELRDMFGNVWEYVWDSEENMIDEDKAEAHLLLGGSFCPANSPPKNTLCPFPEKPYQGHYATGFRIAKGKRDSSKFSDAAAIPSWMVRKDAVLHPLKPMDKKTLFEILTKEIQLIKVVNAGRANESDFTDPVDNEDARKRRATADAENRKFLGKISEEQYRKILEENKIEVKPRTPYDLNIGKCEVPYSAWKLVKAWAENNGYSFNYSGDMGSSRHSTDKCASHSQDEPVTSISWHDALVFCNALSEIFGKSPAYFNDAEKKYPYKNAILFRLDMFDARNGTPILPWEASSGKAKGRTAHSGAGVKIFFDGASNGFRLPTNEEFKLAEASGECVSTDCEWTAANSGDKTQPVLCKTGEGSRLSGMRGNVLEWGWDSDTQYFNPQNSIYEVNGSGYFYEGEKAPRKKEWFYTDYPANAKSIIGIRVSSK